MVGPQRPGVGPTVQMLETIQDFVQQLGLDGWPDHPRPSPMRDDFGPTRGVPWLSPLWRNGPSMLVESGVAGSTAWTSGYGRHTRGIRSAPIRELLTRKHAPSGSHLQAGGRPSHVFPSPRFRGACCKVLDQQPRLAFEWGAFEGYEPVRDGRRSQRPLRDAGEGGEGLDPIRFPRVSTSSANS